MRFKDIVVKILKFFNPPNPIPWWRDSNITWEDMYIEDGGHIYPRPGFYEPLDPNFISSGGGSYEMVGNKYYSWMEEILKT